MTANAAERLIQHYVDNFRRLPWRLAPGSPPADPYRVWLSEIMLQQTTVHTVVPRYQRFVERWPTIEALAAAADEDILQEWAGLGYYARARNLIACAREIARIGAFPPTSEELRKLPGIGAYISAAIAAIAFGKEAAAVDTNVERVVSRLHALSKANHDEIRQLVRAMIPVGRAGDFTQAMMDLGATICRPRNPRCNECPLRPDCAAYASGTPESFPAPRVRKPRPVRYGVAWWIERDHHVWFVRRPARGLLGGMAALPGSEWTEAGQEAAGTLGTVRHVFTHFALDLAIVEQEEPVGEGWWQPIEALAEAGLPTLYRRAAELALAAKETHRAAA